MPLKFVRIPATGCDVSESELNHFMGSHRVLAVEKRFVDVGENSFWAVCVDYLDGGSAGDKSSNRSSAAGLNRRCLRCKVFWQSYHCAARRHWADIVIAATRALTKPRCGTRVVTDTVRDVRERSAPTGCSPHPNCCIR